MSGLVPRGTSSKTALAESQSTLQLYEAILKREGDTRGLLGPRELEIVWDRHILNCLTLVELIPLNSTVADIGSGAGLPGIVLAVARPDLAVTLVEPTLRRVEFLNETKAELNLENLSIIQGRAEDLIKGKRFEIVTARAVAPMKKLLNLCLPLLKPGGYLLALKGEKANIELTEALEQISKWNATSLGIVKLGLEINTQATVVVVKAKENE
jgi:16S rRNA (guanine527-N7)-methyltransferase